MKTHVRTANTSFGAKLAGRVLLRVNGRQERISKPRLSEEQSPRSDEPNSYRDWVEIMAGRAVHLLIRQSYAGCGATCQGSRSDGPVRARRAAPAAWKVAALETSQNNWRTLRTGGAKRARHPGRLSTNGECLPLVRLAILGAQTLRAPSHSRSCSAAARRTCLHARYANRTYIWRRCHGIPQWPDYGVHEKPLRERR